MPNLQLVLARRAAVLASLLLPPALLAAPPASLDCPPAARAPTAERLQALAATARDHGFLWRIERDGRHSWLYGSLHVARLEWVFPGPRLGAALREARTLAVELDVTDPNLLTSLRALPASAATSAEGLPPALRERLARHVQAECLPPGALDGLPAALQAATLSALAGRRDGLDPAYGIDGVLAGAAHAGHVDVVALETLAQQLAALQGASPADARRFVEDALDELDEARARPLLLELARTWAEGDLAALQDYERWCDCVHDDRDRAFMRRLLDDRNPALADKIDALHRERGVVLAAIGALHMIGPRGLPALLAARGYRVERIALAP